MPFYDPLFLFFGRLLEPFGYSDGITACKLQLVYLHWTVWLAFAAAAWLVYRRARKNPRFPWKTLPLFVWIIMMVYCAIVGWTCFNDRFFSHYMLYWPPHLRLQSMLRSAFIVGVPTALLYLMASPSRKDLRSNWAPYAFLFFVFHAAATVVYLLCPFVATE